MEAIKSGISHKPDFTQVLNFSLDDKSKFIDVSKEVTLYRKPTSKYTFEKSNGIQLPHPAIQIPQPEVEWSSSQLVYFEVSCNL
jgi:hypothetical protein